MLLLSVLCAILRLATPLYFFFSSDLLSTPVGWQIHGHGVTVNLHLHTFIVEGILVSCTVQCSSVRLQ